MLFLCYFPAISQFIFSNSSTQAIQTVLCWLGLIIWDQLPRWLTGYQVSLIRAGGCGGQLRAYCPGDLSAEIIDDSRAEITYQKINLLVDWHACLYLQCADSPLSLTLCPALPHSVRQGAALPGSYWKWMRTAGRCHEKPTGLVLSEWQLAALIIISLLFGFNNMRVAEPVLHSHKYIQS